MRFFLYLIVLLNFTSVALAKPEVSAARLGEHPDRTRFVLEISESPAYRVFTLPDPFRVVIDLPEFSWTLPPLQTPRSGGLVVAMRHGLFAPGTSRIVLDASKPVRLDKVFVLEPSEGKPFRFVIDILQVSRSTYFAQPQGAPISSAKPFAPVRQAALRQVAPKPPSDPRPTIVIDAGHGGVDPGARGLSGIVEKDITLAYAKTLRQLLVSSGRYRVIMTRDRDQFLKLRDRVDIAQRANADLFISLHANKHNSHKVRGASIYTLSEGSSDAEAEALATKENAADALAGVDLAEQSDDVREILIDLAQRETMNHSKKFANTVVGEIGKVTPLLRNTHRFAGFAVLKSATVPSVLFEIGYLSNRSEEGKMRTSAHRNKVAASVLRAIDSHFAWRKSLSKS